MLDGLTIAFRNARDVAQKARRISDERLSRSSWKFGDGGPGVIVTQ